MDEQQLQDFLRRIAMMESSGGKNTNHAPVVKGVNKGDTAIGTYGLMPETIREIANRAQNQGPTPALYGALSQADNQGIRDMVGSDPTLEQQLARDMATRVLHKTGGSEPQAAYMWNSGSNLNPQTLDSGTLLSDPYVQKYSNLQGQDALNDSKIEALKKILQSGYAAN